MLQLSVIRVAQVFTLCSRKHVSTLVTVQCFSSHVLPFDIFRNQIRDGISITVATSGSI